MSTTPSVYVDFQNADSAGRIRLNTTGSLRDLSALSGGPSEGLVVRLESEELRATGVMRFSSDEQIWVAELDWSEVEDRGR